MLDRLFVLVRLEELGILGMLQLVQTIALVATLIVVAWYTWETQKLRTLSERSLAFQRSIHRPAVLYNMYYRHGFWVVHSVRNHGPETAFDVRVEIHPRLEEVMQPIAKPIPSLPPGAEFEWIVCKHDELQAMHSDLTFRGEVHYRDKTGEGWNEPFEIELQRRATSFVWYDIHDVADALNNLSSAFSGFIRGDINHHPFIRVVDAQDHDEFKRYQREKHMERFLRHLGRSGELNESTPPEPPPGNDET